MVDFFRDMSHGQLDLSRSRVFGWYTLDKTLSDYKSGVAADVNEGRGALIEWARQAAEVDLTEHGPFFSVMVCMNVVTDVFGGATGAACDDGREPVGTLAEGVSSMSPSVVGQEMGHVYGLQHSRRYGSPDAYKDRWDAMSTKGSPYMAAHPFFTEKDRHSGGPVFRMGRA